MDNRKELIKQRLRDSILVKQRMLEDDLIGEALIYIADKMADALKNGGRVLFCGNGGSAADAQHFAAELSGKFLLDRQPLDAEALHVNTSFLTAVANDYSYEDVYARLVRAKGRPGDVIVGISTSGNSLNVICALEAAREMGMFTVGLTGEGGGRMGAVCDMLIAVPSRSTPRIQEGHLIIGHMICEMIEFACCGEGKER